MISDVDMVAARDDWNVSGLDPVVVRHGLLSLPDRAAAVCCAFHFAFLGYVWMLQAFNKCRICVDFSFCRFRGIQRINTPLSDPANVLEAVPLTCRKTVMKLVQDAIALASACTETDDAARWGGAGRRKNCTTQADDGELEVDSPFMEAGMDSLGLTGWIFTLPVVRFLNRFVPADATLVGKVFPASL